MSHFSVLVIGDNPEEQLQPYHEYECTGIKDQHVIFLPPSETEETLKKEWEENKQDYPTFDDFMSGYYGYEQNEGKYGRWTNPNAKWDWYELGGRWTGYLKLKNGAYGRTGKPGLMTAPAKPGYADAALKKHIDFIGMELSATETANAEWEEMNSIIGPIETGVSEHVTWEKAKEMYPHIEQARTYYNNQPKVKAFDTFNKDSNFKYGVFSTVDQFLVSKEDYIKNSVNASFQTFAVVKDAQWYERGKMGWFGMSSNEKNPDQWAYEFKNLIDRLPQDTLMSIYDCHI